MLPAFASPDDLITRMGDDGLDRARAQAALDDASALIRAEASKTWVTGSTLDADVPDIVTVVCVAAARRVLENPQGATAMSVGDASMSLANASTDVYLTAAEKRLVRRAAGLSGAMGSVTMEVGTPGWTGDTIAVAGQDEPIAFTYEPLRP